MTPIALGDPTRGGPTPGFAPRGSSPPSRAACRQGRVLVGAGLALLPWLGYLAATLPPAEAAAWVTLDTFEAAALIAAGSRLLHGDNRHRLPAAAAAVLLVADACVDLATATPGTELATAVVMAVVAEIPLAALCAMLSARPPRGACPAASSPSLPPVPSSGSTSDHQGARRPWPARGGWRTVRIGTVPRGETGTSSARTSRNHSPRPPVLSTGIATDSTPLSLFTTEVRGDPWSTPSTRWPPACTNCWWRS
ncbi:hypothetical protein [Streptomyces globisporus]|uniref:hypothetical protein n=1 Tax=Streptomyces globisporus TaxID=1908 RepID=UPI001F1906FD|nr:hypothetical protein [Streptomyces globisporus]